MTLVFYAQIGSLKLLKTEISVTKIDPCSSYGAKIEKNRVIKPGENRGLIGICTEKSNFNSLLKERENSSRSSKTKKIMGLPNLYFLLLLFSLLSFLQTPTSAAKKASLHLYFFFILFIIFFISYFKFISLQQSCH